jgi:heptosyltransferase-2
MGKKILIIKLAAIGDVLRTTSLLYALKRRYPKSHISWLVDKQAAEILSNNSFIDRVLVFNLESALRLESEEFDLVLSLDKEVRATALAMKIKAGEKLGFGFGSEGNIYPLNKESEYAFSLGLSDELKFKRNTLTYQQQICDMCKLRYQNDEYILQLSNRDVDYAHSLLERLGGLNNNLVIGLNTGAGRRFANKSWTISGYIELIQRLNRELDCSILILGGPEEAERNNQIARGVKEQAINVGCDYSIMQFAAIINFCDLVVSADTTALHIAIALKKKTIAIIGPTCPQEIELYGRGEKVVSRLDCAPCYKNICDKQITCMQQIHPDEVLAAIKRQIR